MKSIFIETLNLLNLQNHKNRFTNYNVCNDRILKLPLCERDYFAPNITPIEYSHDHNYIILIMESPHKLEFQQSPPKPALGPTGKNIVKYFSDIKTEITNFEATHLLLMNAIQFQCSLGDSTKTLFLNKPKTLRLTKVFDTFWDNGGKQDFEKRLGNILKISPNSVILNACTLGERGLRKIKINDSIQNIKTSFPHVSTYVIGHPYSWLNELNRQLEKI